MIQWSPGARSSYLRFLRELASLRPSAAMAAEQAVREALDMLEEHPLRGRPSSRWSAYREWSLLRQHKLLVYRHTDRDLVVGGFFDTRQDLFAAVPE